MKELVFQTTNPCELAKSLGGSIFFEKEGIVAQVPGLLDMENFVYWLKDHGYEFSFRWRRYEIVVIFKLPAGALPLPLPSAKS